MKRKGKGIKKETEKTDDRDKAAPIMPPPDGTGLTMATPAHPPMTAPPILLSNVNQALVQAMGQDAGYNRKLLSDLDVMSGQSNEMVWAAG